MLDGVVLSVAEILEKNEIIKSIDSVLETCSHHQECEYCEERIKLFEGSSRYCCGAARSIGTETKNFVKKTGLKDSDLEKAIMTVNIATVNYLDYSIIYALENLKGKLRL